MTLLTKQINPITQIICDETGIVITREKPGNHGDSDHVITLDWHEAAFLIDVLTDAHRVMNHGG